ncbi:hypothetical protein KTN05_15510 [Paracoccus sp. Z118]|uniref:hypothetical protein n=1 Tax=Paracoccus sp. Z118 TaxID=2851017 RepID=UPI001C2C306D|nr:hypothetical protein [Paracoccus sp. Z118]MBV0893220.1 hypothetical protein [Paracoccus sp. Z118]
MHWLLRAVRWVRNPPSPQMVRMLVAVFLIALAIATIEWMGWWPEWATQERMRRQGPLR